MLRGSVWGERRVCANQNVALRLKAKKSSKKPRFFFSAAKHLERPHRYWTFRGKGNEIDNPVRGRKLYYLLSLNIVLVE